VHLEVLLDMAADGLGDRNVVGARGGGLTATELADQARRVAAWLADQPGEHLVFVDVSSEALPVALFGAALSGRPFAPLSYRLADDQLRRIVDQLTGVLVAGPGVAERLGGDVGLTLVDRDELLAVARDHDRPLLNRAGGDGDDVAVLLFTSGTTGPPKGAVLRHRHLTSYVMATVEFGGAAEGDAALVSVPPYHVASVAAMLTSLYAGRRVVQLAAFEPEEWVALARREAITHAMVVPTMLGRILDVLEGRGDAVGALPALRTLSYGGGPMPASVVERALRLLREVDFVNAYGLTETSSTIAVLGPEEHRSAFASTDPGHRARLGSVGRPIPGVEVSIRDEAGAPVAVGAHGEVWVRGEQVSGEYVGLGGLDADGWFHTRDSGRLDEDGYLFLGGRLDDVIVRGGENLSPGQIEAVLVEHTAVRDAAVVGVPDEEWGEAVHAVVVLQPGAEASTEELQAHVRANLRSVCTPATVELRSELPYNETGKLLRRMLRPPESSDQVR